MNAKIILLIVPFYSGFLTFSQEQKPSLNEFEKLGGATKSEEFTLECAGEITAPTTDLKWKPILINKCVSRKPQAQNYEKIKQLKAEKLLARQENETKDLGGEVYTKTVNPVMGANWLGNLNNGSSPMDNSIAISNGGIIVSVSNTTVEVDNSNGTLLYYNDLASFFNDPGITSTCDPVVLYDKIADRFILFFQECSGSSGNTFLCICFSQTNNPGTGGWWKYKITGNPLGNFTWFDYPKMAISDNELYITGNLFDNSSNFNQSILYQIPKAVCYAGGNINWQYWYNISGFPFTLLPVSDGQGLSHGPGCFLVSTSSSGGNSINLYELTDDMSASNEQLNFYSVPTTFYSPAANASQLGTSVQLDNGDCRALSGFYLNGVIHFVFHSDIGGTWNGINYNRLNLSTLSNVSSTFGQQGSFDYSYPSVSSYATSPSDKSVMIGFGRSGSSIFPEVRVVNCDDGMNWSSSTLVKSSSSFVDAFSSSVERWGDYSGTARKHNSPTPSIWMNGMFGNSSNRWDTWIAEIHNNAVGLQEEEPTSKLEIFPNPIVETFYVEFDLESGMEIEIFILDASGKLVKDLFKGTAHAGENVFTFNKSNLSNGTYFLVIENNSNKIINEKISITN